MLTVTLGFYFFQGVADRGFHFIKQCGPESVAQESIVEVIDIAPKAVVTVTALCNEAVDVGVPFEVPAKSVQDHNEAGSEVHGFVLFEEHAGDNTVDGMEEAVKEGAVMKEKVTEVFINGKNAVSVDGIDKFKGHGSGALHGIHVAAGRAEAAVAAERYKLKLATVRACKHGPAKRGVAAMNHFFYVFNNRGTWVQSINNFFVIVFENIL